MPKAKVSTDAARWYEKRERAAVAYERERAAAAKATKALAKVDGKGKSTPKSPNKRRQGSKPLGSIRRRAKALSGRRDNRRRLIAAKAR